MKRWFSLILLGLIASVATAQVVVHGRILSAVDKTPIEMATVRLFIYKANDNSKNQYRDKILVLT